MKKNFLSILIIQLLFVSLTHCQSWFGSGISGEGPVVEKTLDIKDFDSFTLGISGKVFLSQGKNYEVKVSGQQNIIDNLTTRVFDREWKISFENNVRRYDKLEIHITMPDLKKAHISGSGDVSSSNSFTGLGEVSLSISGSGNLKLDLEAQSISSRISGSGDVDLRGSTDKLELKVSGSGNIDAEELRSNYADINVSGSGNCEVNVAEELDVRIAGSGDVVYSGKPRVNTRISGSGSLRSK